MAISTTYSPLESAGTALATAIGLSWPTLTGTPSGESVADLDRAQRLLEQMAKERTAYSTKAGAYNAALTLEAEAAADYAAALAAYTPWLSTAWSELDLSVRSAEQELTDIGAPGSWAPGTATTPTDDVAALASRVRTAERACRPYPTLAPVREALLQALSSLESADDKPPTQRSVNVPPEPEPAYLDAIVAKANQYTEYLNGS